MSSKVDSALLVTHPFSIIWKCIGYSIEHFNAEVKGKGFRDRTWKYSWFFDFWIYFDKSKNKEAVLFLLDYDKIWK